MRHILAALGLCAIAAPHSLGQTSISGIRFADRVAPGQFVPGSIRGSLGVIDYDRDGFPDLVIAAAAGNGPDRLFHNVPDPANPGNRTLVDVTATSGFDSTDNVNRGAGAVLVADYDNDGFSDIFFAAYQGADNSMGLLYHNDGNGHFTEVGVAAGVRSIGFVPDSASFNDFDHDGYVDLLICNITASSARTLRLLHNNGNGTFSDASSLTPALPVYSSIYSHMWFDYDGDGWDDAFILLNSGSPALLKNVPNPAGGRMLVDVAAAAGFTHLGPAPMGIAAGDFDGDGDLDLAITDAVRGTYYENRAGSLVEITPFATFFGWGVMWIDADNDGRLDNYQAGSWGAAAVDHLTRNLGGGQWQDISAALNTTVLASQYSVQVDFNNDGRQDIITMNPGSAQLLSVYENLSTTSNHWFRVRATGTPGVTDSSGVGGRVNADAIGAIVRVIAGGVTQVREIVSGSSTCSTEDFRADFGLGATPIVDRVEIIWPRTGSLVSRTSAYPGPFAADQIVTLTPRCPADRDGSGAVNSGDVTAFLGAWFQDLLSGTLAADFNGDGAVNSGDVTAFLNAWFDEVLAGC